MEKYIAESLEFLGLDYIDNFDIHGINDRNDFENTIKKGGCLSAVEDAIAKGLIRHLGFSTHAPLPVILDVINTDIFESVNLHYYFIHQSNRAAVDLAAHKDMGVFIISPSEKGGMLFKPSAKMKKLCEPYTPVEMNDRWLLSNPAVCTISCGASEPEHIDQHLGAILSGPIPNDTDRCIFARLESEKARTRDFCIECRKCLPCPEGIPIPMVLRMRNAREAFDLTEYASWRYNMMNPGDKWLGGTKGDKCTECGDCVPRCPVELNIPKLLKDFHKECSRMTE
jgi:predicted aldo/keto reductase-like oxidoreductase